MTDIEQAIQPEEQQQSGPPHYEYKVLSDILYGDIPTECNFYAIIDECSVKRPTKRKDWMCNVRLMDPSTLEDQHLQEGVEVLMFGDPCWLPNPDCVGDIMRIHRLTVQEFNQRPQLVATVGPRRKAQVCLFKGRAVEGEAIMPYFSSTPSFTMGEREENLVKLLRNVMGLVEGSVDGRSASKYLKKIRELDPSNMFTENAEGVLVRNTFFDICCKVLHVQGERNRKIVWVWDGTDAMPMHRWADTRGDFAEDENVELNEDRELLEFTPVELPLQECVEDVPRLGTALPVRLYGLQGLLHEVPLPEPGAWVKLRNVAACTVSGQLQGLFRKSSKWSPCQPTQEAQQILEKREAQGTVQEWAPADTYGLLASTSYPHIPFQTLREVHQAAAMKSGCRHRCLVRVVGFSPPDATLWCSRAEACGVTGDVGDFVYTFNLTLQDATGMIDALVFREDGTALFRGMPAEDLNANPAQAEFLKGVICKLIESDVDRESSWIECCLNSYTRSKGTPQERRCTRIFQTQLQAHLLNR